MVHPRQDFGKSKSAGRRKVVAVAPVSRSLPPQAKWLIREGETFGAALRRLRNESQGRRRLRLYVTFNVNDHRLKVTASAHFNRR